MEEAELMVMMMMHARAGAGGRGWVRRLGRGCVQNQKTVVVQISAQ